jgi:hypothetical protein
MWPMIVSAMLRALSSILSVMDNGKAFIFLRDPGEQGQATPQELLGELLADIALIAEELAGERSVCLRF